MPRRRLETSIKKLTQVLQDPNCERMPASVKGFLGELIVKQKIEKEAGRENIVNHKGGHGSYDLEYGGAKIDVKTSALKMEFQGTGQYWGWALIMQAKKRPITATHFVCVALNEDYSPNSYYVIPSASVGDNFIQVPRQFKKVKYGLLVNNNTKIGDAPEDWKRAFNQGEKLLKDRVITKVQLEGELLKALGIPNV